jgi:hypothetical protein
MYCAVTVSAGGSPVARCLLDWAGGWRLGRTQQIQSLNASTGEHCPTWRRLGGLSRLLGRAA